MDFERIAIVNRGEAAMRLLHAVEELNRAAGGRRPLRTVALYTEPDRHAWFVREADEAYCLGPATTLDGRGARVHTYLDYERLEAALVDSRAEAAWVGWGFVAEHAAFAELCERLGIVFIGPPSAVIRRLGDKIEAKRLAEGAGVPVSPWSGGPVGDAVEARAAARRIGYPLFVKASAGGGGRGIRRVEGPDDLDQAVEWARAEAHHAFGDPTVFLERQITAARHVEVQVIADAYGAVWAPGVRDCSLQRRHQKVIEESACTLLDAGQEAWLRDAAVRLCQAAGYRNAGTVEFLYSPEERRFHFMEVNARLQVEHPVTELTTGLDLVKLQLHVAAGGRLDGACPPVVGHAIEARLCAEDADNGFAPAPGPVEYLRAPGGPGIRIDTGVAEGDEIAPEFDSMIAKVLAWGHDRAEARARLGRALAQTTAILQGGRTNKAFLLTLLEHPDVVAGRHDTGWLDRHLGDLLERPYGAEALLCAAVEAYDVEHERDRGRFFVAASRGRPPQDGPCGCRVEFRYRGRSYPFVVYRLSPRAYRVDTGGALVDLVVNRLSRYERNVTIGSRSYRVTAVAEGPLHTVEVDGITHTITRDEGGVVRAPSPGVVISLAVGPGDEVAAGDPLAVLETMKMETVVAAAFPGRVRAVDAIAGTQVAAGAALMNLEPVAGAADDGPGAEPLQFEFGPSGAAGGAGASCGPQFDGLRSYLLGYDLDPASGRNLLTDVPCLLGRPGAGAAELEGCENEFLDLFADLCAVTRREPGPEAPPGGTVDDDAAPLRRAPEEHLLAYIRSPLVAAKRLPGGFTQRVEAVLRRHGITTVERGAELDEGLFRLYHSQSRIAEVAPVVEAVLDRRLGRTDEARPAPDDRQRALLDRLVTATEARFPVVTDLARELRYHLFEQPVLEQAEAETLAAMDGHLTALAAGPAPADQRSEHLERLIGCPRPLRPVLLERFRHGDAAMRNVALEVATRRYYRIRRLGDLRLVDAGRHRLAVADYEYEGRTIYLMVAFAPAEELADLVGAVRHHLRGAAAPRPILDVHLWRAGEPASADELGDQLRRTMEDAGFGQPVNRVDITVTSDRPAPLLPVTHHFTYREAGGHLSEERLYRNLHPMLAKRLEIGRLANFHIDRLPSAEDVYLFHAVARDNPKDERLFALAEVRDLTPVRDESGAIVGLPLVERIVIEALSSMRRFQSHRPLSRRLLDNLLILHVRPPWEIPAAFWQDLAHRLAPAVTGLGIERVIVNVRVPDHRTGQLRDATIHVTHPGARGVVVNLARPDEGPIPSLSAYRQRVVQTERRGSVYPYEIIRMLTPPADAGSDFPSGSFVEFDLEDGDTGRLRPVDRPYGQNRANLVVGVIRNSLPAVPEGVTRVVVAGDPSHDLGALAEPECRRIIAALDLAEQLGVPVEWYAVSSGARISMASGTENMDWIGAVLRRLIEFTQAGGEVNVIVTGINVGAQPYWNAEATMLMHTKGILVMLPQSAMVLTGKQALDFSGGVSAEDNLGIGGYERIMGPNGQGQYWAPDLEAACEILLRHYGYTYVVPGERFPRRTPTADPIDRDAGASPHPPVDGSDFTTVGDVMSGSRNAERKKAFDIRAVMRAVADRDDVPLERWARMRDADTAVTWDARIGGIPVCLLGFESHPLPREGTGPGDGPGAWTSGTLFPRSSKKVARSINAASGNRPVVVLANLSGFDGSPESLREWQLEFGAEIGRAVVNFSGPIVFVVVSRYHGGAFVVFSKRLNDGMEVAAVEGSMASVIGGAPAAAVVFARDVDARTKADPRVAGAAQAVERLTGREQQAARRELAAITDAVRAEKLGEVAEEFDAVHSIQRALEVGSVDRIIPPSSLRPYIVGALERGIARQLAGTGVAQVQEERAAR